MDIQTKLKKRYSESYLNEIFDERVPKVLILETYRGSIFIELFHKDVPLVKDIIAKALLGELDGMVFYNCNPFFVQLRKKVEEKELADKVIRPYLRNLKGTVGLINSKKNPSKALLDHFYICLSEIPEIDGEYTIIGRVVKGLDVLNKIWDGNTVRRCYIEKGYITKPPVIKKLHVLYWVGVALMIFFAFWVMSLHLNILKEFQKEIFKQVITDKISKTEAIYFLFVGLAIIIFSLVVSGLEAKLKVGEMPKRKEKEEEKEIMKKIEEKRIGVIKALEEHIKKLEESKEKELKKEEEQKKIEEAKKQEEKLRKEIEELRKKAEEERKEIEKLKEIIEIERKKAEEEKKKFEEKLKEEIKKRLSEERKKEEERRKEEEKKKEELVKEKLKEKPVELDKERKKMIEIMQKPTDLKKEMKKKPKEEIKKEVLPKIAQRTETQLDVLYDLLEKHKSLKLSFITETFGISKEEAIEWCNILVEHGLADLKYPAFGEPILIKK